MKNKDSVLAFLVTPQWAPFTAVFTGLFSIATIIAIGYNYHTTFAGLTILGLGGMIGVVLTVMVQAYQFVAPAIRHLDLMDDPLWEVGLYAGWIVFVAVDFFTAFVYILPPNATLIQYGLTCAVAFIFLIAEILLWLGIKATATLSAIAWNARIPQWLGSNQSKKHSPAPSVTQPYVSRAVTLRERGQPVSQH
jgi:hypothetical protein